jgi:hypothetical protein
VKNKKSSLNNQDINENLSKIKIDKMGKKINDL